MKLKMSSASTSRSPRSTCCPEIHAWLAVRTRLVIQVSSCLVAADAFVSPVLVMRSLGGVDSASKNVQGNEGKVEGKSGGWGRQEPVWRAQETKENSKNRRGQGKE